VEVILLSSGGGGGDVWCSGLLSSWPLCHGVVAWSPYLGAGVGASTGCHTVLPEALGIATRNEVKSRLYRHRWRIIIVLPRSSCFKIHGWSSCNSLNCDGSSLKLRFRKARLNAGRKLNIYPSSPPSSEKLPHLAPKFLPIRTSHVQLFHHHLLIPNVLEGDRHSTDTEQIDRLIPSHKSVPSRAPIITILRSNCGV
jgi:hypothetical protein